MAASRLGLAPPPEMAMGSGILSGTAGRDASRAPQICSTDTIPGIALMAPAICGEIL
jgi:hypothetical protein